MFEILFFLFRYVWSSVELTLLIDFTTRNILGRYETSFKSQYQRQMDKNGGGETEREYVVLIMQFF